MATTTQAAGTFEIDSWDQDTYDDAPGATLARATVAKTFHGGLEGSSRTELLLANATESSAGYVGLERFTGSLDGRFGTFVLQHSATMSPTGRSLAWTVVPDSGSGELTGLTGEGRIRVADDGSHAYTLDYALP